MQALRNAAILAVILPQARAMLRKFSKNKIFLTILAIAIAIKYLKMLKIR